MNLVEKDFKWKEMAERTTILRADVGSRGFGLSLPTSDDDHMGVCIEDFDAYCRIEGKFEQHIEHHQEGGIDVTIYSMEKFLRLALHGNPTILCLLFAKKKLKSDARGSQLQGLTPYLISKHWGKRFLGYMESQRQKLLGERGQKRVNRPDLEEKFGYDTKYAMHLLRLGIQGVEVMETGKMTIPFTGSNQEFLMAVRFGKIDLNEVLQTAGDLERQLKDLISNSDLPDQPNKIYVDEWMRDTYFRAWQARQVKTSFTGTRESINA